MNCIVCDRDTGENGDHYAVYEDTTGNYGSRVLDLEKVPLRLSICDRCLVERRDRLRAVVEDRCEKCNGRRVWPKSLRSVPDDLLLAEHLESGEAGPVRPPSGVPLA
jgi:hypothetical protein